MTGYQTTLTQPIITTMSRSNSQFAVSVQPVTNFTYSLWRAPILDDLAWIPLTDALVVTNSSTTVTLTDTNALAGQSFYRVVADSP